VPLLTVTELVNVATTVWLAALLTPETEKLAEVWPTVSD
jgi:hypothetical protein